MPLAAAGVGFGVTVVLLGGLWALMCYTALLLLEVYQHVPADTGLGSLAARYLGRYGQWITGFSMMFLMYALTAAYISGAGELIASSINDGFGASLSPETGAIVFTLIGGGVVVRAHRWSICLTVFVQRQNSLPDCDAGAAGTACSQD